MRILVLVAILNSGCSLTGRGDVLAFDQDRDRDLIAEYERGNVPISRSFMLRQTKAQRDTFAAVLTQKEQSIYNEIWPWVAMILGMHLIDRVGSWTAKVRYGKKLACLEATVNGKNAGRRAREPP